MKKLLLATTAVAGLALLASPASAADGLKLDLGGFFKGYAMVSDVDEAAGDAALTSAREFEFRRHSEAHFTGETTLDNGLTVGSHIELNVVDDTATDTFDEAYVYFSGGWGRVNWGAEDGAAYLLQVAAPSADDNVDGLRNWFQSMNLEFAVDPDNDIAGGTGFWGTGSASGRLDYDHADFEEAERVTYLTPKWNGFQAGVSFAPDDTVLTFGDNVGLPEVDTTAGDFEDLWEAAARWDGEFEGVGLSLGAGWSTADVETASAVDGQATDSKDTWNVGGNLSWNAFNLGAAYLNTNNGDLDETAVTGSDTEIWVVGADWTNGPYRVGASWFDREDEDGVWDESDGADDLTNDDLETERFTVGGAYTFGPGMTFRGALAWGEVEGAGITSRDFSQFTLGTQINF